MALTHHVRLSVRVKLTGQIEAKREKHKRTTKSHAQTTLQILVRSLGNIKSDSEIICDKLNGKIDTPIDIDLINPSAENQKENQKITEENQLLRSNTMEIMVNNL